MRGGCVPSYHWGRTGFIMRELSRGRLRCGIGVECVYKLRRWLLPANSGLIGGLHRVRLGIVPGDLGSSRVVGLRRLRGWIVAGSCRLDELRRVLGGSVRWVERVELVHAVLVGVLPEHDGTGRMHELCNWCLLVGFWSHGVRYLSCRPLSRRRGELRLHGLWRGHVHGDDGGDDLHELRRGHVPNKHRGDRLRRMLRRALLGAVGFELCELRRGDVLTSGCERLLELHGGAVRDAHGCVAVHELSPREVFVVGSECVLELRSRSVLGLEWHNRVLRMPNGIQFNGWLLELW